MIALILSLASSLPTAPAAQAAYQADWPTYRHDAARSGRTSHTLEWSDMRLHWQRGFGRPEPAWPGPAQWDAYAALPGLKSMRDYDSAYQPIVVGRFMFFGSNRDSQIYCVDIETGLSIWNHQAAAPIRVAPTYQISPAAPAKPKADQILPAGRLYFGDDSGTLTCLHAANGGVSWQYAPHQHERQLIHDGRFISFAPIRTGVLVRDGQAYFGASFLPWKPSYLYSVRAIDGNTGGKGFARELGAGWTLEGPMLASDRHLVMPQGRVAPLVFSRKDGSPQGTLEGGGGSFCLLTDDDQVLHGPGNKTGWITASGADGRAKIASYDKGNSIVVNGNTAYLLSDRGLSAFDRKSQALIWSRPVDTPFTLIQAGPHLIAGGDGLVRTFDAKTGDELWASEVPGKALGLVAAQNRLFVSTDSGHIVSFGSGEPVPNPLLAEGEPVPGAGWQPASALHWQSAAAVGAAPAVQKLKDRKLIDHWLFQSNTQLQVEIMPGDPRTTTVYANLGSRAMAAQPLGSSQLQRQGNWHCAVLDGRQGDFEVATLAGHDLQPTRATKQSLGGVKIAKAVRDSQLPKSKFSAEAWVRVDRPTEWGGIIGASQDNGEYERGWLLGYRKNHFSFALKSKKGSSRLSWVRAPESFQMGAWHHVVATYDGKQMLLYVDGAQVASGDQASGDVDYPEDGWYQLGAYRDKDEYFRMKGALHEVKLHDRVLKASDVHASYQAKADQIPAPLVIEPPRKQPVANLDLATRPWIRLYHGDHSVGSSVAEQLGSATISWSTAEAMKTEIEFVAAADAPGPDGKFPTPPVGGWKESPPLTYQVVEGAEKVHPRRQHTVVVQGLPPRSVQHFRVIQRDGDQVRRSQIFELDTHFAQPMHAQGEFQSSPTADDDWARLVSGLVTPMVVVVGEEMAEEQRAKIRQVAPGADIRHVDGESLLRMPPMSADAVFVNNANSLKPEAIGRMIAPGGYWLDTKRHRTMPSGFEAVPTRMNQPYWVCQRTASLAGSGSWTHIYGRADNTAYGGESLSGAASVAEMEVQWVAPPGPRYQTDRQNRRPAPLAANGLLFLQGKDRLMALNSFNGQTQWAWELPGLNRFNMPRDCSNWCVDDEHVYVAIDGYLWQLDAERGTQMANYSATALYNEGLPEAQHEKMNWGYVARVNDVLLGSAVRPGNTFTDWWGGTYWYDAREGSATAKVCSDALFAIPGKAPYQNWTYRGGLILNTTITVADDTVYFLENRAAELSQRNERRFAGAGLFDDLHMVALNLRDGSIKWQREAKPLPGDVAVFLAASEGRLVLVTSHKNPSVGEQGGEFAVYCFDAKDGDSQWRRKFTWEVDHHGKSISRPAIVGGHIYLRPVVLNLKDGEFVQQSFPSGHQCGSYAASEHALFLRCGNLSAWSRKDWKATGWERLRPDCWISTIPANGMVLSPEGGGGCSCGSWMETSVGFMPLAADPNAN